MKQAFFITATDTGVGKTIVTSVLGVLAQEHGLRVGVMKPVQCGGDDAQFLKKVLRADDDIKRINPYFVKDPLSPHLVLSRAKIKFDIKKVKKEFSYLKEKYDVVFVEGAGGFLVPITDNYFMADLVKDLDLKVIVVSRLGLGTINHTLLTIEQIRQKGLHLTGVIFNETKKEAKGIPEKTNPFSIQQLSGVSILGQIPFLKKLNRRHIQEKCSGPIDIKRILKSFPIKKTVELVDDDKKYVWHPFTQMKDWTNGQPLIIDKAEGSFLIDSDGNSYLDGVSSLWVNVHGHNHPRMNRGIIEQLNKLDHSTLLGLANSPSIELAKKLVKIAPKGLEKVFYSDNGSTSVEIAIKMAYQYWQNIGCTKKRKLVHLANSYHGDTLGSVSVGGIDLFHKVYRDLIIETVKVNFPDCYRAPKGKKYPDYAFECLDKFETILKREYQDIAAFIVEPIVQGAAGMIIWPKGILKRIETLCRKYDIIFIVDEVATGFGRTGKMFACEHEKVHPDILCLAKGLTGGVLPLAATLTTKKIFDGFIFDYETQKTFFHGHTFTGNPICCAAALANLEIFGKEKTLKSLHPKIKFLQKELQKFYDIKCVGDVRQKGFMVGIELVKNRSTKEAFDWKEKAGIKVCEKARERGVILRPLGNVIVLMPPLSISREELKILCDVTYWAIKEVLEV